MKIHGETVSVSLRQFGTRDKHGNETVSYSEPFEVDNVLVGRGETVDIIEDGRPYAIKADRRFCFPRGITFDLRGALIKRGDITYKVIGNPVGITDENLPHGIDWNIRCEGVYFDG